MALMSEERRKEMEEEMSRFEQEIALPSAPTESPSPPASIPAVPNSSARREVQPEAPRKPKRLSPPPVVNILPAVLCPPPPPPATPPPLPPIPPPPPPPSLPSPVLTGVVQFIPHQLQRQQLQPPRLPLRPPFMGMRGPGPFPPQGLMTHFPPMHHGPPPPHHMHHQHMPVPTMGVGLPLPPGFCPPPVPPMPPPCHHQQNMNPVSQAYMPPVLPPVYNNNTNNNNNPVTTVESTVSETSEPDSVVASAPAVYAAPPMKSQGDKMFEGMTVTNGESPIVSTIAVPVIQRIDKPPVNKTVDDSGGGISASTPVSEEVIVSKKKEKKKKVIRMAGGQAWEDNSLVEWDPDDFRIFCGDLGNDVTDEVLIRAFSKYQSFVKAKVIRDKRTNKTKGYGFVSFKDPQDFIKAMREMNGRYVGSRPIKLRKSTWKDRNIEIVRRKQKEKEKLGLL